MSSPQDASTVPETVESPHQKLHDHLRQYAIVVTTRDAIYAIPFTRQFATSVSPTLKLIRETQPIKMVLDHHDIVADSLLSHLDAVLPESGLINPVVLPVTKVFGEVEASLKSAHGYITKLVVEPSARTINGWRYSFNSAVYDTNGRGLVTSQFDPVVAPINSHLELAVAKWLPEIKPVSHDHSSELARTFHLINNVVHHKVPQPQEA